MSRNNKNELYLSGNNGGDYVKLSQTSNQSSDGTVVIEIGHCCVLSCVSLVPVELLSSVLSNLLINNNYDFNKILNNYCNFDSDYKNELKSKIINKYY